MSHTPGPWRMHNESGVIIVNGSTVYGVKDLTTENEAGLAGDASLDDKRLMAAAPELLAQLKMAADFISGHNECLSVPSGSGDRQWNDYCIGLLEVCKAAIAKAEGRTHEE